MHRILFVDDEPKILTGLRRMLRSMRGDWEMEFAEGGSQALELLQANAFDVVVSDARMPLIEGAELLRRVRREFPDTVRMILSGQCSRESVLRCVGVAHQFLSKPCDAETLKAAVRKVCRLRDTLADQDVRAAVSKVDSLPSVVSTYEAFKQHMTADVPPLRSVSETIVSDIAMSAKVLQLVSSGFFGTPQGVVKVEHATELLGAETIRALLSTTNAFRPFASPDASDVLLQELTVHSVAVSAAAGRIAESVTEDRRVIVQSRIAGLLHEMATLVPFHASGAGDTTPPDDLVLPQGTCSARMSGYLAALWGLPAEIATAIGSHHTPDDDDNNGFTALTAVHVADAYVRTTIDLHRNAPEDVDTDYLARIRCAERLSEWQDICHATCASEVLQ